MQVISALLTRLLHPPSTGVLAHQGGWDELLLVFAPIVVIVAALAVVKRRVDRLPAPRDDEQPDGQPVSDSGDTGV